MSTAMAANKGPTASVASQGNPIVVEIGPGQTKYYIHRAFLVHHSEYFQKALSGSWKESEDGIVKINDIEPGIFNFFVNWIYKQELPTTNEEWAQGPGHPASDLGQKDESAACSIDLTMMMAYVLGDRFGAKTFKDAVNNQYVDYKIRQGSPPLFQTIALAFENLPSSDGMLLFLVDCHCSTWEVPKDEQLSNRIESQLPFDFLARALVRYGDLCKNLKEEGKYKKSGASRLHRCAYHKHSTKEELEECKKQKW